VSDGLCKRFGVVLKGTMSGCLCRWISSTFWDLGSATEGAKFWAGVCAELANWGVKDVLIVCCDGLTGFPEAVQATWPQVTVQTCVVHLIRAARFVNYKDRKPVARSLSSCLCKQGRWASS
jgi:hypothetical protein